MNSSLDEGSPHPGADGRLYFERYNAETGVSYLLHESLEALIPFPGPDTTQFCANFAYFALVFQGLTKDRIFYLSSNSAVDLTRE